MYCDSIHRPLFVGSRSRSVDNPEEARNGPMAKMVKTVPTKSTAPVIQEPPGSGSGLFVSSFAKGLRVLETFDLGRRSLSLSQLAEATGLDKSGVQRFTYTLHALGYLHKDPITKHYSLGPKTLQLGSTYLRSDDLVERAQPLLAECSNALGETINLARIDETDIVYLIRMPSRHAVSVDLMLGTRLPAFCSAMGRVMLAFLPRDDAQEILDRSTLQSFTPHTVTTPRELQQRMKDARQTGFVITDQEIHIGDVSIAAPVFDHTGRVAAAVGIAVPNSRWTVTRVRRKLAPLAIHLGQTLSSQNPGPKWADQIRSLAAVALTP
jgi:IclR family pca regulon transcriptional regulator